MIAGRDLAVITRDLRVKSGMLDCKWFRRVMQPKRGVCSGMALGGGALKVDLDSA